MELAGQLQRTPRELLASLGLAEFFAYVLLARDRADEMEETKRQSRRSRRGLGAPAAPSADLLDAGADDLAAAFGGRVKRVAVK